MNLAQRQGLSLDEKIILSQNRIKEWYDHWDAQVHVAFSGGKDSTVLKHLVETTVGVYDVPSVFCNTGLEYPEVVAFAQSQPNVTTIRPKMTFKAVIEKYGYPVISKEQAQFLCEYRHTQSDVLREMRWNGNRWGLGKISKKWRFVADAPFEVSHTCCAVMKKRPLDAFDKSTGRKPILGTMATESSLRTTQYAKRGCNAFDTAHPKSTPMAFWTEQDVFEYITRFELPYASVYGDIIRDDAGQYRTTGCDRTGCMFCMFGVQYETEPNRFQRMAESHPRQYDYCMNELGLAVVLDYLGVAF
jgi:3'-phosphoadenosine 5'-phosphosulfate sulfotransferase (PAPS reductase)/FAD synthetase